MILVACIFLYLAIAKGFSTTAICLTCIWYASGNILSGYLCNSKQMSIKNGGLFQYFYTQMNGPAIPYFPGVGAMTILDL